MDLRKCGEDKLQFPEKGKKCPGICRLRAEGILCSGRRFLTRKRVIDNITLEFRYIIKIEVCL